MCDRYCTFLIVLAFTVSPLHSRSAYSSTETASPTLITLSELSSCKSEKDHGMRYVIITILTVLCMYVKHPYVMNVISAILIVLCMYVKYPYIMIVIMK